MDDWSMLWLITIAIVVGAAVLLIIAWLNSWTTVTVAQVQAETSKSIAAQETDKVTRVETIKQGTKVTQATLAAGSIEKQVDTQLKMKQQDTVMHQQAMAVVLEGQKVDLEKTTIMASSIVTKTDIQSKTALQINDKNVQLGLKSLEAAQEGLKASLATEEQIAAGRAVLEEKVAELQANTVKYTADKRLAIEQDRHKTMLEGHSRSCTTTERIAAAHQRLETTRAQLMSGVETTRIQAEQRMNEDLNRTDRYTQEQKTTRTQYKSCAKVMETAIKAASGGGGLGQTLQELGGSLLNGGRPGGAIQNGIRNGFGNSNGNSNEPGFNGFGSGRPGILSSSRILSQPSASELGSGLSEPIRAITAAPILRLPSTSTVPDTTSGFVTNATPAGANSNSP